MIGSYELVRRLGAGGMAEVWLARKECLEGFSREVVVKRILPQLSGDPRFVQMLFNEARIAARLSHPNIVSIFDFGEDDHGTYYLAMEHVNGVDLHQLMHRLRATRSKMKPELALRIVAECCKALAYAHQRENGVIHRDVSPSNILIGFDGTVKLADFGIAKATDQVSLTQPGMLKGKFSYMSPEQATGQELDPRSDLFSLGLVLYELLTQARPYKRKNELESLRAAIACKVPPPSKLAPIDPELEALVMKAMAKSRDARYRDARALQLAAERLLVSKQWVASSVHLAQEMARLFPSMAPDASLLAPEEAVKTITEPERRYTPEEFSTAPMPPPRPPLPAPRRRPSNSRTPRVSPSRRRWRRLSLAAGMGAALTLALVLFAAKRTAASPLPEGPLFSLVEARPAAAAPGAEDDTGLLSVATTPPTEVYLRSRKLGISPLKDVHLPVGRQPIRLVNPKAHVDQVVTVEIRPGQSSDLKVSW